MLSPLQSHIAYGQYVYQSLADFNWSDGGNPLGSLTVCGTTLYGMAAFGGSDQYSGTIFSVSTTGGAITDMYDFANNGGSRNPAGSLTLVGTTFYGLSNGVPGCVFSITTAGSSSFTALQPAQQACGTLLLSGTTLYGQRPGCVFSMPTNGSSITQISANGDPNVFVNDGSLSLVGNTLYGFGGYYGGMVTVTDSTGMPLGTAPASTGPYGGNVWAEYNDPQTLFSISTSANQGATTLLHKFGLELEGTPGAPSVPCGTLNLVGSTFYGMTSYGGAHGLGTIYSINTDGSNFQDLYDFSGGAGDGANPFGSLTLVGSTFYGMTNEGGANNDGAIFSFSDTGGSPTIVYSFSGGGDGANPCGSLTLSGSTLYGTTKSGGNGGWQGTIFAISSTALNVAPSQVNGTWINASGGSWSTGGNWDVGVAPGGNPLDTAVFGTVLTSGTAIVALDSSQTLAALGFNTPSGASYVISASNGSTLTLANTAAGAATLSNSGGNHTIAAPIVLGSNLSVIAAPGSTLCVSGPISESNAGTTLSVSGGGTLVLSGSNTYSGATTVDASTFQIGNGGSGEYLASPSITMSNNATVAFNHSDPLSYGGVISGSGQLIKLGTGNLDLVGSGTYSGPTTISAGTLELDGGGNNLPAATALTIASSGVLDMAGNPLTVGGLSGSAGAIVMNSLSSSYLSTLTVASSSGSTTFAGNIVGNNALALSGSGALTLSGTNTYTGGTTVSGGTLDIAAPSALAGSGLVTIAAGGRLVLGSGAGDRRFACGLVAGQFGRSRLERGGVDSDDNRRR